MSVLMEEMETHATQSRLPTSPTFPLLSDILLAPFAKSPHLGVQTEEERSDIIRHPRWHLIMKMAISAATPHGTAARGRLLLALCAERVGKPAGGSQRMLWHRWREGTCVCDDRQAERKRRTRKVNKLLKCKSSDMRFACYLQTHTDSTKAQRPKISHMPHSFRRISQIKSNAAPRVKITSLFPDMWHESRRIGCW